MIIFAFLALFGVIYVAETQPVPVDKTTEEIVEYKRPIRETGPGRDK